MAGNPPDIIGPAGRHRGPYLFRDQLQDSRCSSRRELHAACVAPQARRLLQDRRRRPDRLYAVYPSFLFYNKDLFDEANLLYPPTKVGDMYQGKPWDMAALALLGQKPTVDKNGNDADERIVRSRERGAVGF